MFVTQETQQNWTSGVLTQVLPKLKGHSTDFQFSGLRTVLQRTMWGCIMGSVEFNVLELYQGSKSKNIPFSLKSHSSGVVL